VAATNRREKGTTQEEIIERPEGCHRGYLFEGRPKEVAEESEVDGHLHSNSDLDFGYDLLYKSEQIIGIQFPLNIPAGVTITSAHIQFTVSETSLYPVYYKIQIEDIADSAPFSSSYGVTERDFQKKSSLDPCRPMDLGDHNLYS